MGKTISGFDMATEQRTIDYLSSYVETMQDRIDQGDPRKRLYEERIMFFEKAVEMLKTFADEIARVKAELATVITESRRREKAAVEDLRENADRKCYVCAHWVNGRCAIPERDCAGFYRWEWRGPQEEGREKDGAINSKNP